MMKFHYIAKDTNSMNNTERKKVSRERAKSTLSTKEALADWLIKQVAILHGSDSNFDINSIFYESLTDEQKKNAEKILSKEWNEKIHAVII